MKDHEIAHLVNELRGIAVTYGNAEQLRSRISDCVNNAIKNAAMVGGPHPLAWLTQCKASGLFEQAEPNEKAGNPEHWTDAFPVFAEQPAPVSTDLSPLREYHAKAVENLTNYADDAGLRDSDVKHYTKRAEFHLQMVALIDGLAP